MITKVLYCPYCQGTDISRHGTTSEDKQLPLSYVLTRPWAHVSVGLYLCLSIA